ncbi:extracellular solute-binding protein [Falsiroseomonas oryzae]|uniref:extracellular solute-binding protein n=1 Tax=Falsiroseomonas oryzae TaxID=2766473 RepID=UPI0022EA9314|nr:extracellular solute-binding protein [Roseomonas sp. MO-31]
MIPTSRRGLLAASLAAAAAGTARGAAAQARPTSFTVISHRVHQQVLTEGQAGDVLNAWRERNNASLDWVTLDLNAIHDRIFREARLSSSNVTMAYVLNTRAVPSTFSMFEPLDPYQQRDPIEDFDDFSQGMVSAFSNNGQRYGVPVRHSVNCLHYNEAYLQERGLDRPPQIIDELVDYARRLTFTRADGTQVFGWGIQADNYSDVVAIARACGGDLITEDMRCVADQPGMVRALEIIRQLYQDGLMPRNITAMKQNDMITAVQNGQIAMHNFPFGRTVLFNNPRSSRFPGRFKTTYCMTSREQRERGELIATAEFWCMMIPRNARAKDMAWSLIKEISSKENTIRAAMNGNQPARVSAYADPRLLASVPYAEQEARSLQQSRVPMPAFDRSAEAKDIFVEEMQAAMLGMRTPQAAGANMARRIRPLLPRT